MNEHGLDGAGVLVTRPEHQSAELKTAIEIAGGRAILFPALDIVPHTAEQIEQALEALPTPDIVLFVSANAVRHGLAAITADNVQIGAIGPATALALKAAGSYASISSTRGADSEHLLDTEALADVAGKNVIIVRGSAGRERLAKTLRQRGASVNYLSVYQRQTHTPSQESLQKLEKFWREGQIDAVVVMSIASLDSLLEILPPSCSDLLRKTRLVAPSARVIQTALERFPGIDCCLSQAPGATDITAALIESLQAKSDTKHG